MRCRARIFAAILAAGFLFSTGLGILDLPLTLAWHDLYRARPSDRLFDDPHLETFWAATVVYYPAALALPCVVLGLLVAGCSPTSWWASNRWRLLRAAFVAHGAILIAQAAIAAMPYWMNDWFGGFRMRLLADAGVVGGTLGGYWATWRLTRAFLARQWFSKKLLPTGVLCACLMVVAAEGKLSQGIRVRGLGPPGVAPPSKSSQRRPNVLLVVLDTLRADRLGCYGYQRDTSPNLDLFAGGATLFERAVAPSGWTIPSHASLFTGLPESLHGVDWGNLVLPEKFVTLAEVLSDGGYRTLGLSCNPVLTRSAGFAQGFDQWQEVTPIRWKWVHHLGFWRGHRAFTRWTGYRADWGLTPLLEPDKGARQLYQMVTQWLGQYRSERPFFIFLNYNETHTPYQPPLSLLRRWLSRDQLAAAARVSRRVEALAVRADPGDTAPLTTEELAVAEALYDGEVRRVDGQIGRLLTLLHDKRLFENTLIVITSDHGEHLGEHRRMGHFNSLYEPIIHVPLIVRFPHPRCPGTRVKRLVRTIDLPATILRTCDLAEMLPEAVEDVDLSRLDDHADWPEVAVSEVGCSPACRAPQSRGSASPLGAAMRCLRALSTQRWKWLEDEQHARQLFDLDADPGETNNLAVAEIEVATALRGRLARWLTRFARDRRPTTRSTTPADLDKRLRDLGYIQ